MVAKREVDRSVWLPATDASAARQSGTCETSSKRPGRERPHSISDTSGFEDRFRGSEDAIRARLLGLCSVFQGRVECPRCWLRPRRVPRSCFAERAFRRRAWISIRRWSKSAAHTGWTQRWLTRAVTCSSQADESLGGLIAVQVIEHLDPGYLTQMLGLAFDKVRPGGQASFSKRSTRRAGWRFSRASFATCRM